jgi:carbon-monoxide dehydrogenase large subunit
MARVSETGSLIGEPLPPAANARFVAGQGLYTDDYRFPDEVHMVILRSPHASARILSVNTSQARLAPGVLAVLTGDDVAHDGLGPLQSLIERKRKDGSRHFEPFFPILAQGEVNHVGFPIAAIVAEKMTDAIEAVDLIEVAYDIRPAVTATRHLLEADVPLVWPDAGSNLCFLHEVGDESKVDAAIRSAAHVVTIDIDMSRVSANPMENRNAIGNYDRRSGRYTLYTGSQVVHDLRAELARSVLHIPESDLRVVSPDVGGAFGMKIAATPEHGLVLWAARRLGRPVRWQATRTEALLSDWHARDVVSQVTLALDSNAQFVALKVENIANLGAYLCANTLHSPTNNLGGLSGPYRTPNIFARVRGAFSHSNPTSPYRGAGRPEATYAIERVIDAAARHLSYDPAELRRKNLIPRAALPFNTGFIFTYDSGDFAANLDRVIDASDWAHFPNRRSAAERVGKLRGIGIANAIEIAGGPAGAPLEEFMEIRFDAAGHAVILTGLHSHGQGLETVIPQVLHDQLYVPIDTMRLVFGDTDQVYHGKGAGGSRSAAVGSTLAVDVARKILEKGCKIAAHVLEAAEADIEFTQGEFRIAGTDRSVTLSDVARISFDRLKLPKGIEPGLSAQSVLSPSAANFPNGCHVCEVEIDPETGVIRIVGYWAVEDVGRVLNPLVVEGQVHGGVAQGLGQVLCEQIVYDPENGQLLSASFLDYAMPRAKDVPFIEAQFNPIPTQANTLGVKGAGEAGTVGALPVIMNAINDALTHAGADEIEMPATPFKIWQALHKKAGTKRV